MFCYSNKNTNKEKNHENTTPKASSSVSFDPFVVAPLGEEESCTRVTSISVIASRRHLDDDDEDDKRNNDEDEGVVFS